MSKKAGSTQRHVRYKELGKKKQTFLVSQSLINLLHVSNTFYHLCYCNNILERQRDVPLAFGFSDTAAKKHAPTKAHKASYKFGVTMHDDKYWKRSWHITATDQQWGHTLPNRRNIAAFGHSLKPKPKPAPFRLLQSHFLKIWLWFSMKANKNLDLQI